MSDGPGQPRLAATILLARDDPDQAPPLQVLLVKRHAKIEFAGGALVFPGGKTSREDADPAWSAQCDGDYDADERTIRVAAIREAFEEAGILFARRSNARGPGKPVLGQQAFKTILPARLGVDVGEVSFLQLMQDNGLVLALDCLIHFGHWITPDMMPKRFDTHFYLAEMPPDQVAEQDGRETTEAVWLAPSQALDLAARGEASIIFPTRMNLGKLAEAPSTKSAIQRFARTPVMTIKPELDHDAGGAPVLRIPAEAGYLQTVEPLTSAQKGVGVKPD